MRLVDSKQMQEMDRYTIEEVGIPGIVLMENAARSWVETAKPYFNASSAIFVFCGSGNNGGDGYAIARNLVSQGFNCQVVAVRPPKSEDCIRNANIWTHYGTTTDWESFIQTNTQVKESDTIIDAILGTGIESEIQGELVDVIKELESLPGFKIAVDLPSGISASTGDLLGVAIHHRLTITFQKEKVGQHLEPGKSYSGKTVCTPISILERYQEDDREIRLFDRSGAAAILPRRRQDSYKNTYGHLLSWCGTQGTLGAAFLASYSAMKIGAGLSTAALPADAVSAFVSIAPELMSCPQETITLDYINRFDALVIGCGLGRGADRWAKILPILKATDIPIVLDADAFYGIAQWDDLDLRNKVLTPHPGEFSQMTGWPKPGNNGELIQQGLDFIEKHPATLVLKGAPTLIFSPDRVIYINSTGNSGMSTAGSGDVLSGIIGGLLAQGLTPISAALLGVWLHGRSGDIYATQHCEESLTAMSLIDNLDHAIKDLKSER